ncbi:MAG: SDR family oxidoreductase [Thermomicrobiales bacterium]
MGQLTRAMAVEWAEQNIQVNAICPGWIETELTKPLWADEHRRGWILGRVPVNRPASRATLVGYGDLLRLPASDFTTGQCFYIDGGFMAGGSGRRLTPRLAPLVDGRADERQLAHLVPVISFSLPSVRVSRTWISR